MKQWNGLIHHTLYAHKSL